MKVWITKKTTLADHYHTNKDCQYLNRANGIKERDHTQYPNKELCSVCDKGYTRDTNPSRGLLGMLESGEIDYE